MVKLWNRVASVANLTNIGEDQNSMRRAYSEININHPTDELRQSMLTLSANRVNLGEKIIVSWSLSVDPTVKDSLALYYEGKKVIAWYTFTNCFTFSFYNMNFR